MANKKIYGDIDVQGAIKHNGQEISYEGGGGIPDIRSEITNYGRVSTEEAEQRIVFPSNILPLRLTDNNVGSHYEKTFLFNYKKNTIILPNGFIVGYLQYNSGENRIEAFIDVDPELIEDSTELEVDFMFHNGQVTLENLMNVSNLYIDEKTAPLQAGLSFKSGITTNDVHIQYKMMQMDGGTEETYDSDAGSTKFATITDFKYIDGVPAILNPSPDGAGDLWYTYMGTETVDGQEYDKWYAEYSEDQSLTYYALSNRIVEQSGYCKHTLAISEFAGEPDETIKVVFISSDRTQITKNNLLEQINKHAKKIIGSNGYYMNDATSKFLFGTVDTCWANLSTNQVHIIVSNTSNDNIISKSCTITTTGFFSVSDEVIIL